MLDEADNTLLLSSSDKLGVVLEQLDRGFGDEDMQPTLDCVEGDGVVSAWKNQGQNSPAVPSEDVLSGVNMMTASPGESLSMAVLSA